jgi:hypothetical protein
MRLLLAMLVVFGLFPASLSAQPPEALDMLQRNVDRLKALQASGSALPGIMSGLWSIGGDLAQGASPILTVWHFENVYMEYGVDPKTGDLSLAGVAELVNGGWQGWFVTSCRGCCPGHRWWHPGVITPPAPGSPAFTVRVAGKQTDRDKCVETETPTDLQGRMEPRHAFKFKELLPGKIIHVVGAPAVGNQSAQYKASVTVQWNFAEVPVAGVEVVALYAKGGGTQLVPRTAAGQGEREFLTDTPGKYRFLLTAWNRKGQPMHFELMSVDIPAIPGINR